MVKIKGNTITMTRGDTLLVAVGMETKNGDTYIPVEGDSLRFALKHKTMNGTKSEFVDDEPLINKPIPIDTCILQLDPADTKPLGFGDYVYDIELTLANGYVDTFIYEAKFTLAPEVH